MPVAWIIDRDHLFESVQEGPDRKGFGTAFAEMANEGWRDRNLKWKFRIYDDDGELYYSGRANEECFAPLDWAMNDAGATEIHYLQKDGKWTRL